MVPSLRGKGKHKDFEGNAQTKHLYGILKWF